MAWEIKSTNKLITTLIPIFLLLINVLASPVSAIDENYKTYETSSYYTAGSVILIKIEGETAVKPTGIVYELLDAYGHMVYRWKHRPDVTRQIGVLNWYIYDEFEIKLPNMMNLLIFEERPEGEWEIKTYLEYSKGLIDGSEKHSYLNVHKGNILDNLFAPIYIYKGYRIFGIEIANMQFTVPPVGYIFIVILFIILVALLIRYIKFAYKESKEIAKKSKTRIREKLGEKV